MFISLDFVRVLTFVFAFPRCFLARTADSRISLCESAARNGGQCVVSSLSNVCAYNDSILIVMHCLIQDAIKCSLWTYVVVI